MRNIFGVFCSFFGMLAEYSLTLNKSMDLTEDKGGLLGGWIRTFRNPGVATMLWNIEVFTKGDGVKEIGQMRISSDAKTDKW